MEHSNQKAKQKPKTEWNGQWHKCYLSAVNQRWFAARGNIHCTARTHTHRHTLTRRMNGDNNWIHFAFSTVLPTPIRFCLLRSLRRTTSHKRKIKYITYICVYLLACKGWNWSKLRREATSRQAQIPNWLTAAEWLMILCPFFSHNQRFWMLPRRRFSSSLLCCFPLCHLRSCYIYMLSLFLLFIFSHFVGVCVCVWCDRRRVG